MNRPLPALTHYTGEDALRKILAIGGFGYLPNPRHLIKKFVPEHDWSEREPQFSDMVSFTEAQVGEAAEIRKRFGGFGVRMTSQWSIRNRATKTIYVHDSGPVFESLCFLFQNSFRDVQSKIRFPNDKVWAMARTEKNLASAVAGSPLYANMLQLYEHFEPLENWWQREWRIVNPATMYADGYLSKEERIGQINPPEGWRILSVLKFVPSDLVDLICPAEKSETLRSFLPEVFQGISLTTY